MTDSYESHNSYDSSESYNSPEEVMVPLSQMIKKDAKHARKDTEDNDLSYDLTNDFPNNPFKAAPRQRHKKNPNHKGDNTNDNDSSNKERARILKGEGEDAQATRAFLKGPPVQLPLKVIQELLVLLLLSLKVVQEVAEGDPIYQRLKVTVKGEEKHEDRHMVPYVAVWTKLKVIQGLI